MKPRRRVIYPDGRIEIETGPREWKEQLLKMENGGAWPMCVDHRIFCYPEEYGVKSLPPETNQEELEMAKEGGK